MVETGYLTRDSILVEDDVYPVMAELHHEWTATRPVTYTQETSERAIRAMLAGIGSMLAAAVVLLASSDKARAAGTQGNLPLIAIVLPGVGVAM
jgi:hypothetical protein